MTATRQPRTVRVALAGCGTVGGALLDLLSEHEHEIAQRNGLHFEVRRILVRDLSRPRSPNVNRSLLTTRVGELLDTDCDVIVEALGGIHPAYQIAGSALAGGRGFVTANKALLRTHGQQLSDLAQLYATDGAWMEFEGAVGGGVPLVRLLRHSLAGHGVQSVRGVLNGTTNYILSRIERGASFDSALSAARTAGFAEANPIRDLSGVDAADKIAVLAWLAFGVNPADVPVEIEALPDALEMAARQTCAQGQRLRLVATAEYNSGTVSARVGPEYLDQDDPLAAAIDEDNIIQIRSASSGIVTVSGRGAGGKATASAVLADLLRVPSHTPCHAS